jgi:hypothetical protein
MWDEPGGQWLPQLSGLPQDSDHMQQQTMSRTGTVLSHSTTSLSLRIVTTLHSVKSNEKMKLQRGCHCLHVWLFHWGFHFIKARITTSPEGR